MRVFVLTLAGVGAICIDCYGFWLSLISSHSFWTWFTVYSFLPIKRKTCGFLLPVFHKYQQDNPNPFANRPSGGRGYGGRGGRGGPGGRGRPPMGGGPPSKPLLLVLAPTRELSVQILEEAQKFGRPIGVRSVCCYGGSSKFPQIAALERGVECIIATPGRLNDLIDMKKVDLSGIQFLVLDEADRMLDMVRCVFVYCLCLWRL